MTRTVIAGGIGAAIVLGLGGCTGTETGNPFSSEADTAATSSDETVAALGEPRGGVGVSDAWIAIGRVELRACDGVGVDLALVAPRFAPLVAGGMAVEEDEPFATFDSSVGTYCRVVVELATSAEPPPDAPSTLDERSVVVQGQRSDGTAFELLSTATPTIDAPIAELATTGGGVGVLLVFDVARWFDGVDLATATVDADGLVHVDDARNSALLHAFEGNLAPAAAVHEDLDRDGTLDPDEPPIGHHGG